MNRDEAREAVLVSAKNAFAAKLFAGTSGNLSVRISDENLVAITPTCIRYETMKFEDIVLIDFDGNIVEGRHKPSSEWQMHLEVMRQMSSVNAVVHTHSPYATAFAVVHRRIPQVLIEMIPFLGGDVPLADYAQPGTLELGKNAVRALGHDRFGCLMANHGVLTIGETIAQAYLRAEYVEDAAKICAYAEGLGKPVIIS